MLINFNKIMYRSCDLDQIRIISFCRSNCRYRWRTKEDLNWFSIYKKLKNQICLTKLIPWNHINLNLSLDFSQLYLYYQLTPRHQNRLPDFRWTRSILNKESGQNVDCIDFFQEKHQFLPAEFLRSRFLNSPIFHKSSFFHQFRLFSENDFLAEIFDDWKLYLTPKLFTLWDL